MKSFLERICTYLLEDLPLFNPVVRDAKFYHPYCQDNQHSMDAIDRTLAAVWDALGEKAIPLFNLKPITTKHELSDLGRKELDKF